MDQRSDERVGQQEDGSRFFLTFPFAPDRHHPQFHKDIYALPATLRLCFVEVDRVDSRRAWKRERQHAFDGVFPKLGAGDTWSMDDYPDRYLAKKVVARSRSKRCGFVVGCPSANEMTKRKMVGTRNSSTSVDFVVGRAKVIFLCCDWRVLGRLVFTPSFQIP